MKARGPAMLLVNVRWTAASAVALGRAWLFSYVRDLVHYLLGVFLPPPPKLSHGSVHVFDIVARHKIPVSLASKANFVLRFNAVKPADYVLANEVSLYSLTDAEAVFVEVDPTDLDRVYGRREDGAPSPFLFDSQFALARRVICMTTSTLHTIAQRIEVDPGRVIVVSNTTRCGSMLLCDVLQSARAGAVVFREPDALTGVLLLGNMPTASKRLFLHSVLRVLCKGVNDGGALRPRPLVVIKPRGHCIKLLLDMNAALPGCRHLFLYRDALATIISMTRAYGTEPAQLWRYWLLQSAFARRLCPTLAAGLKGIIIISDSDDLNWAREEAYFCALPMLAKYTLLWSIICQTYVQCREAGVPISACKLEALQQDSAGTCKAVFEWCGLDSDAAQSAAAAMATADDAHGASLFSRDRLRPFSMPAVDVPGLLHTMNDICLKCGVPRVDGPCLLPGTIPARP